MTNEPLHTETPLGRHLHHLRLRGLSPRTVRAREWVVGHVCAHTGTADPLRIDAARLRGWREDVDGLAVNTIATYVAHVRQFYAWAVDDGLIDADPSRGLPTPETRRGEPRPMGEDDLMRAIGSASGRVRLWLTLGGYAGLRAHSIARSRVEDVRRGLRPPAWVVAPYAGKRRHGYTVPICGVVAAELDAYGLPAAGWCFPDPRTAAGHLSAEAVYKAVNRHLASLGIRDTMHATRHRFGSAVYAQTRDIHLTARLLGHANVNTAAVYAAVADDAAAAAVDNLPTPTREGQT